MNKDKDVVLEELERRKKNSLKRLITLCISGGAWFLLLFCMKYAFSKFEIIIQSFVVLSMIMIFPYLIKLLINYHSIMGEMLEYIGNKK